MNFLLNRRITITMLFTSLTLLGYVSYKQLPIELFPNADLPVINVTVRAPQEMDPAYIESEAVIPVEGAISAISGVERIESNISPTNATIRVEFKSTINFRVTELKLGEKMKEVAATLPEGYQVRVAAQQQSGTSRNFMTLQVRGPGDVDRIRNIVDENILRDLENIEGIASVGVYGGRQKVIEIKLNKDMCQALNLTTRSITNLLSRNTSERVFVGNIKEADHQYFVHVNSLYTKVSDLENIIVAPGPVLLKDIATVFFDVKEETSISRINGKSSITVNLANDARANIVELAHRVLKIIDTLNERIAPEDLEIVVTTNNAETMENNIDQIINLALMGGLLAVLILWFFLKNFRLVFFVSLSIPISVFVAFNFFYVAGISINSLTLVGIALAVGMLIDNSVVVLESIYRLSGQGMPAKQAVTQGTVEVWRSIVAATLTTITVFLPFVFSKEYNLKLLGNHVGVSIITTLLVSLAVALLFIPMVVNAVLRKKSSGSVFYEKISIYQRAIQVYIVLLKTCMRNPGVVIFGSIILLFLSLILSLSLNVQQKREVTSDRFNIYVTMRTGTLLETTDEFVKSIEAALEEIPEKKDVNCVINAEDARVTLVLQKDFEKIGNRTVAEIKADIQSKMPKVQGTEIIVSDAMSSPSSSASTALTGMEQFMSMMGIGSNQERILIKGSDYEMMQLVAEELSYYLNEQDFIRNTQVSYPRRQPEIHLDFDQILLTSYEISTANISSGLQTLTPIISSGTTLKIGEKIYDINISYKVPVEKENLPPKKATIDDLKLVQIQNARGGLHTLKDLASVNQTTGRARITRVNQDKQLVLRYSFLLSIEQSKALLDTYRATISEIITGYNVPAGVAIEGVPEDNQYSDFEFLFMASFLLIFIILACVFESFTTPLIMMFSIPLAAIGSLVALLITSNSLLSANTLVGFLILIGIVTNNGIILIDYANLLRKRGNRRTRAVITAALSRVRPILITSTTTIIALFPLAMGDTQYAGAIGAPFAITVIGGLTFSTLLTLVIIPTLYLGLDNTLNWYRTLPLRTKIIHSLFVIAGTALIYFYADGLLWKSLYFVALIILVPGTTFFIQSSLRHAKADIIDPNKEIEIVVSNLVKIYDRAGLFSREWNSGLELRKRLGLTDDCRTLKDFVHLLWQFALWGFLIYFIYFYLENGFWTFVLSIALYIFTLHLWRKIRCYLFYKFNSSKLVIYLNRIIFWILPPVVLFGLYKKIDNTAVISLTGIIWGLGIAIYVISQYLYSHDINIERITGRFSGFKRSFFRFIKSVPIIGKQRRPFKALRGATFTIKTGMFGLLGPNGAGKSTFMRMVTGILEPSYGSIWINGLDTRIYREELQSLIGFLPQEFGTYENMTANEFLDYQAILKGLTDKKAREERIDYVINSVHLTDRKHDKIGSFSGGMKQRIGIALILLHLPRILVVDEPTAGLDPRERIRFRNLLVELSKNRIVIFSTHIIEDISSSCNQVVVVDKGELKYFGIPEQMVQRADGKVWQFQIDKESFETKLSKALVVHNIQVGDMIQVRYLSVEQPYPGAVQVEANLEDAYLCLLKNM